MPKKRHHNQYSKPPSVAPASLRLSSSQSTSERHESSVNELLTNLRRTTLSPHASSSNSSNFSAVTAPSVPPTLRRLLGVPETPAPSLRRPQRRDATGRRLPPGPPPPRSWISLSPSAPALSKLGKDGTKGRIRHWSIPGVYAPAEGSLMNIVLRRMALDWEQQRDWNRFYIYALPSRLRSALLGNVLEYYSPGVSMMDLRLVLSGPSDAELAEYGLPPPDASTFNDDVFSLDLTGSIGKSLSLKELNELLFGSKKPMTPAAVAVLDSWDAPAPVAGTIKLLPNLTHLSLAIDPGSAPSVSWKQLLALAAKMPQLTHLSLAGWPVPSLTPNAHLAKMTSPTTGQSVQYGGTGPYSHVLDDDWTEAIFLVKRLARLLYGLEYLDLTGCGDWFRALQARSEGEFKVDLVDWVGDWGKITTLRLNTGYALTDNSSKAEVLRFAEWVDSAVAVEKHIRAQRAGRGRWITVERDTLSESAVAVVERERRENLLF